MPVSKVPLQPSSSLPSSAEGGQKQQQRALSPKGEDRGSMLLAGTSVTTTAESEDGYGTVAVCLATGIASEKGQMISQILHPTEPLFRYDVELPTVRRHSESDATPAVFCIKSNILPSQAQDSTRTGRGENRLNLWVDGQVLTMLFLYACVVMVATFVLLANSGLEANFVTRWQFVRPLVHKQHDTQNTNVAALPTDVLLLDIVLASVMPCCMQLSPCDVAGCHIQVLEAVSETISPLLPVVLLVGQQQAALRLAKQGITTLQPKRIAIAGRVDTFCVDKSAHAQPHSLAFASSIVSIIRSRCCGRPQCTAKALTPNQNVRVCVRVRAAGTLTCPDLSWSGVIPASKIKLWQKDWQQYGYGGGSRSSSSAVGSEAEPQLGQSSAEQAAAGEQQQRQRRDSESWAGRPVASIDSLPHRIVSGLATCHSLTHIPQALPTYRDRFDYAGNRVDMAMFAATGWGLKESGERRVVQNLDSGEALVVARRFEFDHSTQLMTVLVQRPTVDDGEGEVFTKGSFEAVAALCNPSSVPAEAAAAANAYAGRGSYVLALAQRSIAHDSIHGDHAALAKMNRAEVEVPGEYEFLGLILFQ